MEEARKTRGRNGGKEKGNEGAKCGCTTSETVLKKKETVITIPCRCVFSSVLSRVMEGRACKTIFLRKYGRQESKGVI